MPGADFHTEIDQPLEAVFRRIADLKAYKTWLPSSTLFSETRDISDDPIRRGTTYTDKGRTTTMHGRVTAYEAPMRLGFQQEMTTRLLGRASKLTIEIHYTLKRTKTGTHIKRTFELQGTGIYRLAQPLLMNRIRREDDRILKALKRSFER